MDATRFILERTECTGPLAARNLVELGLNPYTADLMLTPTGYYPEGIILGPFTPLQKKQKCTPLWSTTRLLQLLPFTDDFFWSLTRNEVDGMFKMLVFCKGREIKNSDSELLNVVLPAVIFCLDEHQMPARLLLEGMCETERLFTDTISKGCSFDPILPD